MVAAAIIGAAVVGAGASMASSNASSKAASGASAAATEANQANIDASNQQYYQTREDYAPYREAGTAALDRLNAASSGDLSQFYASPGYEFTLSEGQKAQQNSFAAAGGALSGNALKALSDYNQSMASNEYNNWWNQQQGLVNTGATGTSGTAAAGQSNVNVITGSNTSTANSVANSLYTTGAARASGISGVGEAANQGISNWLLYKQLYGG